jgi:hypothetical protein
MVTGETYVTRCLLRLLSTVTLFLQICVSQKPVTHLRWEATRGRLPANWADRSINIRPVPQTLQVRTTTQQETEDASACAHVCHRFVVDAARRLVARSPVGPLKTHAKRSCGRPAGDRTRTPTHHKHNVTNSF